ncbi:serine/threonine-protein kinase [Steroidobacter sp.]|uniref:serine/threonine-protein kinase n=1 Tax=Steroidobacter sp. TaxID=1978227 RepID=UPI001A537B7B|nr:serine/threonine-protein kinase [Steroidobacter sp.]MBL8267383.1 protein kinase [Steroidobacter sp.]
MALPAGPASRPLAAASATLAPRVLIITDHTELARSLEHHISIVWADAECRIHAPMISGRLHSAFSAIGFDAVLLDDRSERGRGEEWLENFLYRTGFPPIIYLARGDDAALAARVVERGAVDCVIRERIDHRRLANALRDGVQRRRQELALWRTGSQAEQLSRFGPITILGHRFARELAIGGTSMVYLAESERAGEMVVLKVLRDAPETGDQHLQFSRFLQEYELISKIRHPNVVRIFDLGIADDHAYIAMEYFALGDLRGRIAKGIRPRLALQYLAQMAAALLVVHEVGVLHRDLKPGNIMERADGSLALIDFGLAKHHDVKVEMTGTGEIFGTPYYMSPEQGHGQELDERSDLYSLGVIFFEMLTGKKPFLAPTPMGVIYLHGNAPRPVLNDELKFYQPILDRLLAIAPTDRYGSARELVDELGKLELVFG